MIYHVFNGQVMHLSPNTIKSIIGNAHNVSPKTEKEHFFCVAMFMDVVYDKPKESPYEKLFEDYSYSQYMISYSWKELLTFLIKIKSSDRIVFHSKLPLKVFLPFNLITLLLKKKKFANCSYICWGSDYTFDGKDFIHNFHKFIMNKAFPHYRAIGTLSVVDSQEIQTYYPTANVIYSPYLSTEKRQLMPKSERPSETMPTVMVSHSGWPHNQHIKSFELLKKFVGKIKIVCPLCYGDKDYMDKVINKGKELFGDNFSYFTDLMPKEEYVQFIHDTIDVYVSSAEVQTGLGAIFSCVRSGVKIYVAGNNYESLTEAGFCLNSIVEIENDCYEEFIKPYSINIAENNVQALIERHNNPDAVTNWAYIYE